jgi:hypothetical protein
MSNLGALGQRRLLWPLLLSLLAGAAILLREPRLLLEPRLWGEDGTLYYRYAFQNGVLDALLYIPVNGPGYYSFAQVGASALAAALFAPEAVADVFLWLSLLVQLSPVLVVAFGRSSVWDRPWKQALVCALIVASPAAGIELWLNLVIAMNHFGLAALCVLMEDLREPVGRARAWGQRLLLLAGGLTGPWVVTLTPLFALKARAERSRESRVQLGLLLACCLVQGTVVWLTVSQGALDRQRATDPSPVMMVNVATYAHVLRPLVGSLADGLVETAELRPSLRPGSEPGAYLRGLALLLPVLLAALALVVPPPRRWQRWALLGALLLTSLIASLGALHHIATGRYAYIPGLVLSLLLVDNLGQAATRWQRARRAVSALLLASALGMGIAGWHEHRRLPGWEPDYPAWSTEVARWRADARHVLGGTPDVFDIDLQRRGIAAELKQGLKALEGVTLTAGGRQELLLPVDGLPNFGRLLLDVETGLPHEAFTLSFDFVLPDGQVLATGRLVPLPARSRPGRLALVDAVPRMQDLGRVGALRLRLQVTAPGGGALTIRRARFGDELLFS